MKTRLTGPFGNAIQQHIALRRSLGYFLRAEEAALDSFDRYVALHYSITTVVTRSMIVGYLQTLGHLEKSSRKQVVGMLRQFCRFLFQQNPDNYIPEKGLVPAAKAPFRPHIYTLVEVQRLIQLARQLPPAHSLRPAGFATMIALLWVSGLRIGEALRLNLEDVDLEQGLLHIQQTKNFKSRWVPLHPSSVTALLAYRTQRLKVGCDQSATSPFFVNQRGRRYSHTTVHHPFLAMVRQIGLRSPYGRDPRLHDLRHSFATRSLTELYRDGKDPNAYLPVLATYLGHVNIACTTVYLHPSIELLEIAGQRFSTHVKKIQNLGQGGSCE